jgi:hypothetical protein
MTRPRMLDLFCGAGGCSVGYHRAGFDVVGVDFNPQPNYPFEFHQADALTFPLEGLRRDPRLAAVPGVQRPASRQSGRRVPGPHRPDARGARSVRLPWVMENVPGAPLRYSVELCGSTFGLGADERRRREGRADVPPATPAPAVRDERPDHAGRRASTSGEALGVYGGGPTGRYTFENGARKDRYGAAAATRAPSPRSARRWASTG